jgi:hypothetical protein
VDLVESETVGEEEKEDPCGLPPGGEELICPPIDRDILPSTSHGNAHASSNSWAVVALSAGRPMNYNSTTSSPLTAIGPRENLTDSLSGKSILITCNSSAPGAISTFITTGIGGGSVRR